MDDLTSGEKFRNLRDCEIADYMDRAGVSRLLRPRCPGLKPSAVFHQGACADTTEQDGRYMLDNNFTYTKELLHWALDRRVPLVYASSARYTACRATAWKRPSTKARSMFMPYSKLLFDNYLRRILPQISTTVVGLRYFNVYGPREATRAGWPRWSGSFTSN